MDRPKVPKPCQTYKWCASVDDRYIGSAFVLRTADGCYNVICGGLDNRGRIILRGADEDWELFASEFVDGGYELVPLVPWSWVEVYDRWLVLQREWNYDVSKVREEVE